MKKKRQQPDRRAENSQNQQMGLQHSDTFVHPKVGSELTE